MTTTCSQIAWRVRPASSSPLLRSTGGNLALRMSSSNPGKTSAEELQEMEQIIREMSRQDDATRRERLASMFAKELAGIGVGDEPPPFTALFQAALDKVGGEIQDLARKRVVEMQEMEPTPDPDVYDEKYVPREKLPEEVQFQALIDMMVQSKLLVSRATRDNSK